MPTATSNYLEAKISGHVLQGVAYTMPTLWLGLCTVLGDDASPFGTEVTGGSYIRKATGAYAAYSVSGTIGAQLNTTVTWVNMPACTIVGAFLADAVSAGNGLYYGPLDSPVVLTAGQSFAMGPGDNLILQD